MLTTNLTFSKTAMHAGYMYQTNSRAAALVRFQYEPPLVGQIRYAYTAHTTHTPHLLSWIVRVGDKYAHTALHSSDLRP